MHLISVICINLHFILPYIIRIRQMQFCLSMYHLKSLISVGIIITLLLGIALLYVLVYSFIISSITAQIQTTFRNLFIGVFLTTSILMIFSSLGGIYGIPLVKLGFIRKKNQFIIIYSITMAIYFVSFVVLGCFIIQYPSYLQRECASNSLNQYQLTVNQANNTLCKSCQCYFPSYYTSYTDEQRKTLDEMGLENRTGNGSELLFPENAESCSTWSNQTYGLTTQMIILESFFHCSGWCYVDSNYNLYFLFTNINNGKPNGTCVEALIKFFDQFGYVLEISSFAVSGVLFLILTAVVCLCLHPDRGLKYDSLEMFKKTLQFVQEEGGGGVGDQSGSKEEDFQ